MTSLLANARSLRAHATDAERCLWRHLRNRHLGAYRFRRQQPMAGYVVDFVCMRARLIVEIDGGQHADDLLHDLERTRDLARCGFRVIRFWNHEVLQQTDAVLESILEALIQA